VGRTGHTALQFGWGGGGGKGALQFVGGGGEALRRAPGNGVRGWTSTSQQERYRAYWSVPADPLRLHDS
jgi:hypothetical protein